jgi:hypothetical protein
VVERKVGRGPRQRLHIDTPLGSVEPVQLQRTRLAQPLNAVDKLVPGIVAKGVRRISSMKKISQKFECRNKKKIK